MAGLLPRLPGRPTFGCVVWRPSPASATWRQLRLEGAAWQSACRQGRPAGLVQGSSRRQFPATASHLQNSPLFSLRAQERERHWCRHDSLAAAICVLALVAAALRVEQELSLWEALAHVALVGLALALMAARRLEGYSAWRNVAVVGLASAQAARTPAQGATTLPAGSAGIRLNVGIGA